MGTGPFSNSSEMIRTAEDGKYYLALRYVFRCVYFIFVKEIDFSLKT